MILAFRSFCRRWRSFCLSSKHRPRPSKTPRPAGFWLLLSGGIAYTIGAVLYGLGSKKNPIFHTVFHVFVDIGSILHAVCVLCYVL